MTTPTDPNQRKQSAAEHGPGARAERQSKAAGSTGAASSSGAARNRLRTAIAAIMAPPALPPQAQPPGQRPPSLPAALDESTNDLNRKARWLYQFTWAAILISLAALILAAVAASTQPADEATAAATGQLPLAIGLILAGLANQLLIVYWLKRPQTPEALADSIYTAALLQVFGSWGLSAVSMLLTGGLGSPFAPLLLFFTLFGGLLLSQRYAIGLAAASLLTYTLALGLQDSLPWAAADIQPFYLWIGLVGTLVLATVVYNLTVRTLNNRAENARQDLRQVSETNAQIEAARQALENRTRERTMELERRAHQQAQHLQASAEVASAVVAAPDLESLASEITRLVGRHYGFYHANLLLTNAQGEGLSGIPAAAAALQKPYVAADVRKDVLFVDNPDLPNTRSEVAVPLLIRRGAPERLIGVLDLHSRESGEIPDETLNTLQSLANQIAVAIENLQLLEENRRALESAQRAYAELSGQTWQKTLSAQPVLGYRCTAEGEPLPVAGSWPEEMVHAAHSGQAVQPDTATLAIPIKIRGQLAGVIRLRKSAQAGAWLDEEYELAETINERLAAALESARLYEETRRRAERERLTSQITARLRASNDPNTILQTAAEELRQALQASRARISAGALTIQTGGSEQPPTTASAADEADAVSAASAPDTDNPRGDV